MTTDVQWPRDLQTSPRGLRGAFVMNHADGSDEMAHIIDMISRWSIPPCSDAPFPRPQSFVHPTEWRTDEPPTSGRLPVSFRNQTRHYTRSPVTSANRGVQHGGVDGVGRRPLSLPTRLLLYDARRRGCSAKQSVCRSPRAAGVPTSTRRAMTAALPGSPI
jgi:hypothetical protein